MLWHVYQMLPNLTAETSFTAHISIGQINRSTKHFLLILYIVNTSTQLYLNALYVRFNCNFCQIIKKCQQMMLKVREKRTIITKVPEDAHHLLMFLFGQTTKRMVDTPFKNTKPQHWRWWAHWRERLPSITCLALLLLRVTSTRFWRWLMVLLLTLADIT